MLGATFGLAQCVRSGATTIVDFGASGDMEKFAEAVDLLGVRAYTGLSYRNAIATSAEDGRIEYDWDDNRGEEAFKRAIQLGVELDGAANGRLRTILCPGHPDLTAVDLLARTAREAALHGWPVAVHAAIHALEAERTVGRYRKTPIEMLSEAGLLAPTTIVCHCVFISGHSWSRMRGSNDLRLLGETESTVSHSPLKYEVLGVVLESFSRYAQSGVNMTIGTDFSPRDILAEMRTAMLLSRVADRDVRSADVELAFDAVTVNAARALGREDIGRLEPGAKADVTIVDLGGLHFGAIHDPIESLVMVATGADVDTVMVDGKPILKEGTLVNVNQAELIAAGRDEAQRLWRDMPNWMWGGATIDEIAPRTFAGLGD
jgi:cytosine/adenosine deaminase-related metal-dependent hydrolase